MDSKGARGDSYGLVGEGDARTAGLEFSPPPSYSCRWCGRSLEPRGVVLNGRVSWVGHAPCGCPESAAERAGEEARLAEARERASVARAAASGVPARFIGAPVRDRACRAYLSGFGERPGRGLYIYGGIGTGKTEAASALARRFVDAGYRTRLTTTIGMLESIQETYGAQASSLEACRSFGRCDVLILDDLGKESASAWSVMTLFKVVNMRYEALLPTVMTSQYAPGALARRLGRGGEGDTAGAIASRVFGTSDVVRLSGPDRRLS